MSFLTLQLQKLQLSGSGVNSTDTSITLQSMKLIDGVTDVTMAMFGDIGYMTLEPSTSREEQISFTGITQNPSGTATLTGVTRGLGFQSPYAETSANKKSHSGSVTCVISNTSAFYSQFSALKNNETFTGTKTHTNFPVKSGTTTPTSASQFATKAYVDLVGAGTAVYDQNVIEATAGEILAEGDSIYFKNSDQKWWKTNASAEATSLNVKIGIAQSSAAADAVVNVLIGGLDKTQSGMTPGARQYLGDTDGVLVETPGTYERFIGYAIDATSILLDKETVTADEKDALAGHSGISPDADNKFIDDADTTIAAVQTASTIAFVDSNPDTITDSGSGFLTAGFKVGDSITVSGSVSNDGTYTIKSVVAGTITLIASDTLVAESAGASVTITAATASKVVRLKSDGSLPAVSAKNLTNIIISDIQTSGETINGATLPVACYLNNTDDEWYACDGNNQAKLEFQGFAISNGTDGNDINIQFEGIVSGFTGLTKGAKYYVRDDQTIGTSIGTYEIYVGIAISTTEILIDKGNNAGMQYMGSASATYGNSITVPDGARFAMLQASGSDTGGHPIDIRGLMIAKKGNTVARALDDHYSPASTTGFNASWTTGIAITWAGSQTVSSLTVTAYFYR